MPPLRAVTYNRCSTDEESQKDALAKQVIEAKEAVESKGWLLMDIYVESRSGTSTKNRSEYNRLCDDMLRDTFDVIVIKSQDRLMRNTKDWYLFVDRLCTTGKKLFIYLENKFYTPDDALITGIKAILAEDYSRELSKKINNAHHNRQKNGGTPVLTSNTYGFRKLPDKSIQVVEEEMEIKRRMYQLCAAGYGSRTISAILQNEGILNRNGKPFSDSAILRMIRNPMNKGTVVMNKKHYDFDTKQTFIVPEEDQYVYEHKVPAAVSDELWEAANQAISKRAEKRKCSSEYKGGKYKGKSQLSGKIICGLCGNPYYRRTRRKHQSGQMIYEWKCKSYLETGRNIGGKARPQIRQIPLHKLEGCDNVHLQEEILYDLLNEICEKKYHTDKEKITGKMLEMLKIVLKEKDYFSEIERAKGKKEQISEQMGILVDKLLEGVISDAVYRKKQKELEGKLEELRQRIVSLEKKNAGNSVLRERISKIESFLKDGNEFRKATVAGMLEEIEEIRIFPEYMEISFDIGKVLGLREAEIPVTAVANKIRIDYGSRFQYLKQKQEGREIVIQMMVENPRITAKQIAEKLGISLSGANYQIRALKREGRIEFQGAGGKGQWLVKKRE